MSKALYEEVPRVRVIKKADLPKPDDRFIESHELSLLSLLVRKHPDRAREFLSRLKVSTAA